MKKLFLILFFILITTSVNADLISYHKSEDVYLYKAPPTIYLDTYFNLTDNLLTMYNNNEYVYNIANNDPLLSSSFLDLDNNYIISNFNTFVHFGQWDIGCAITIWGSTSSNYGFSELGSFLDETDDDIWKNVTITNNTAIRYFRFSSNNNCNAGMSVTGGYTEFQIYNSTSFNATGNIKYKDVDDSLNNLQNAYVYINSSVYDYTDINGNYEILNIPNGEYTLYVNKSNAYNTSSIQISQTSSINNFTLLFSKPGIGSPYISGNFIKGNYFHNFKTMKLWENPYYVWGKYELENNETINKVCGYVNITFQCDVIPNQNYTFYFNFSDIYNYNLESWHPSLTGNRSFNSTTIIIHNGTIQTESGFKTISILPQFEREKILKNDFFDYLFIMFMTLLILFIISFGKRK